MTDYKTLYEGMKRCHDDVHNAYIELERDRDMWKWIAFWFATHRDYSCDKENTPDEYLDTLKAKWHEDNPR